MSDFGGDRLVPMRITDVLVAVPASVGVDAGMVVLQEEAAPHRVLRIIIGQPEARGIRAGWEGALPGRPATWDLFTSALGLLGARLSRAVITEVQQARHFFATVEIEHGAELHRLPCRPSDAIALAARRPAATIQCAESVLAAAGMTPDEPPAEPPAPAGTVAGRPGTEAGVAGGPGTEAGVAGGPGTETAAPHDGPGGRAAPALAPGSVEEALRQAASGLEGADPSGLLGNPTPVLDPPAAWRRPVGADGEERPPA